MRRLLTRAGSGFNRLIETRGDWLFVPAGLMLLFSFGRWAKWLALAEFPGLDLRDRIVGAREMALGLNPYAIASDGAGGWPAAALVDPSSFAYGICLNTAPPTVLDLYRLFMHGDWMIMRLFWGSVEWAAFLALCFGLILSVRPRRYRGLVALGLAFGFVMSRTWAKHLQLGQSYVFLAALVGCDVLLLWHARKPLSGWSSGLALALRPSLILLLPVLWLGGRSRTALQAGLLGLGLLAASYLAQGQAWTEYAQFLDQFVPWNRAERPVDNKILAAAALAAAQDGYPITQPREQIGRQPNGHKATWHLADVIHWLPDWLAELSGWPSWRIEAALIAAVIAPFALWAAWRCRGKAAPEALAILVAWLLVLADETAPIRNDYVDIFYLPGIGIAALFAIRHRIGLLQAALLLFAALSFNPVTHPVRHFYYADCSLYHLIMALSLDLALRRDPGLGLIDAPDHRAGA